MQEYPRIILPKTDYKLIDCILSQFFLVRHFDEFPDTPILNELGEIDAFYICRYPHNVNDLSTSLLSHFATEHTKISLTQKGQQDYGECDPNYPGTPLQFEIDYRLDDNRKYWLINHSAATGITVNFEHAKVNYTVISYVRHTPMKWNFWHHSVRWAVDGVDINDRGIFGKSALNDIFRYKIGPKARTEFIRNIKFEIAEHSLIDDNCFKMKFD